MYSDSNQLSSHAFSQTQDDLCECHSHSTTLSQCPHGHKFRRWSLFRWSSHDPEYFFTKGAFAFLNYLQSTSIGFRPLLDIINPPSDPGEIRTR